MLRHSCGYKLANDGQDTRAIQHYLGHRSIASTVRYTKLAPDRFKGSGRIEIAHRAPSDQGVHRGRAAMSQHRLFYFMELKEPKAACGLFPSLSWCCYRVEWRPGQKFHDAYRDVGDGVIEVRQDRFVLAADPGGVEYDAGQTDALMAARFKKRSAEAAQDTSRAAISSLSGLICGFPS